MKQTCKKQNKYPLLFNEYDLYFSKKSRFFVPALRNLWREYSVARVYCDFD